jgi:Transposase IS116/IS110/IS902 family
MRASDDGAGIGPTISSGEVFSKDRDFSAWLGLVRRRISTGDRTILGKISKRGNRWLRVLFEVGITPMIGVDMSIPRCSSSRTLGCPSRNRLPTSRAFRCGRSAVTMEPAREPDRIRDLQRL